MLPASRRPRRLADGDEADRDDADQDPLVVQERERRDDLLDSGRRRDRHGHDVVDHQRRRGDQADRPTDVLPRDRVRAAARRVGDADLAVRDRHGDEQDRDRDADLDAERQGGGAAQDQDAQDLLGRVGRRADRVGAEDRQRLRLATVARRARPRWPAADRRRSPRIDAKARPVEVVGALAASLAVSWPGPV